MTYTPIKQIGNKGGFGTVYECVDENGNNYALKMLNSIDSFSKPRFEREVRLMSRLNHPNVIKLVTYNLTNDTPFYIMPIYSCSLSEILPSLCNDYARQYSIISSLLTGVAYLHSEGVIHRDLKPANILYNSDNDIVITDFGLGIQLDSESATLTKYQIFGTQKYCSPEQAKDSHNVDGRTDIYALGMIIEDIVTGSSNTQISDKNIKYIIEKCTKRDPEDRFQTVNELINYVNAVYTQKLNLTESAQLTQDLLNISLGSKGTSSIPQIALRLQSTDDSELVEQFFVNIDSLMYNQFEDQNEALARALIEKLCEYWSINSWPYSYIDQIAGTVRKIYNASKSADIKSCLLYTLMDISINYNRWYAMGIAQELLEDAKNDPVIDVSIATRLSANHLKLERIVGDINTLPTNIRSAFSKNA